MMTKQPEFILIITALLLCVCLAIPDPARAQTQSQVGLAVRAGFDSYCEDGAWIPLRITLENNGPEIDGEVIVDIPGMVNRSNIYSYPVQLPTVSRKQITLYIVPEGYIRTLDITLRANNKTITGVSVNMDCLSHTDILYGVLAGNPSAFSILNDLDPTNGRGIVAQIEPGDIPENVQGMEALDVLIISDIDTGVFSKAQVDAIHAWVSSGGQLIVTGGPGWQKTAAGISSLLPIIPTGTVTVASLQPFRELTAAVEVPEGSSIAATGELQPNANALTDSTGTPLAAWSSFGAGMVYYLTVDPALDPLKGWDSMLEIYRSFLTSARDRPGWSDGFGDWYLAAQGAATLPGLAMPSVFLICGFLFLYVLAIGPLNYFLLVRLKRRELAWISIPLTILLFSGCAVVVGLLNRGGGAVINRMSIVQSSSGSATAKVDAIVGMYSPSRSTYDLQLGAGLLAHPIPDSYATGGSDNWILQEGTDQSVVKDLRVDVGAVRTFIVEGMVPGLEIEHDLKLTLTGTALTLKGTITNTSATTLEDAVLMVPGIVEKIGTLQPGETTDVAVVLSRAERAGSQDLDLIVTRSFSATSPYYYYYGTDATITDVIGGMNYYDDARLYRRYSLLASAMTSQNSGLTGRGGGIYLAGWSDTTPLDIQAAGKLPGQVETLDTTLHIVTLDPELPVHNGMIPLTPPMFTWKVIDSTEYSDISPYSAYITAGGYTLDFSLVHPVSYSRVESLVLHLNSSSINASSLSFSLFDFTSGYFSEVEVLSWGDVNVPDPEKFVGPGGRVLLMVQSKGMGSGGSLEQTDFTLTVAP